MFQITINTDNAAFMAEDETARPYNELIRILDVIAHDLGREYRQGNVQDINGNTVGEWSLQD